MKSCAGLSVKLYRILYFKIDIFKTSGELCLDHPEQCRNGVPSP